MSRDQDVGAAGQSTGGTDQCPACGGHVYRGSYKGKSVYKCAYPITDCPLNAQWHKEHGDDEYRTPLGKTKAQVRRVNAEFSTRSMITYTDQSTEGNDAE